MIKIDWKNKKNYIMIGIAVVFLVVIGILIWDLVKTSKEAKERAEELRIQQGQLVQNLDDNNLENNNLENNELEDPLENVVRVKHPYEEMFLQNEDVAAWLVVDGTNIDYPMMQTPWDENHYLYLDFYGNEDKAGSLILDTDSSLEGKNTTNLIVHGHNMKDGRMFGEIEKYQEEEYGNEHKYMTIHTATEERQYELVSVFYTEVYFVTDLVFKYYNFFDADTEEEFQYFYKNIKEMSMYDTGVTAELGDHFLTLSTCSYQTEDGRFVVVAKEIGRGPYYEEIVVDKDE